MKIELELDDSLCAQALALAPDGAGIADLVCESLRLFVRVQSAKRLAELGGHDPSMRSVPRRPRKGT